MSLFPVHSEFQLSILLTSYENVQERQRAFMFRLVCRNKKQERLDLDLIILIMSDNQPISLFKLFENLFEKHMNQLLTSSGPVFPSYLDVSWWNVSLTWHYTSAANDRLLLFVTTVMSECQAIRTFGFRCCKSVNKCREVISVTLVFPFLFHFGFSLLLLPFCFHFCMCFHLCFYIFTVPVFPLILFLLTEVILTQLVIMTYWVTLSFAKTQFLTLVLNQNSV